MLESSTTNSRALIVAPLSANGTLWDAAIQAGFDRHDVRVDAYAAAEIISDSCQ